MIKGWKSGKLHFLTVHPRKSPLKNKHSDRRHNETCHIFWLLCASHMHRIKTKLDMLWVWLRPSSILHWCGAVANWGCAKDVHKEPLVLSSMMPANKLAAQRPLVNWLRAGCWVNNIEVFVYKFNFVLYVGYSISIEFFSLMGRSKLNLWCFPSRISCCPSRINWLHRGH